MSDSDSEIESRQRPGTSLNAESEEVEDEIDIAGLVTKLLSDRKNANVLCDLLRKRSKIFFVNHERMSSDREKDSFKQMISTRKNYSLQLVPLKNGFSSKLTMVS